MKIGKITYNGTASDTLGLFVSGKGTFDAAELDAIKYEIPGRSGDIIISNNRWKNIAVTYPAFIPGNFDGVVQAVRNWMRSATGYARIEDNFDADHYRMGIGTGILTFAPVNQNIAANCQLVFDCKPQRFLKSGETESTKTTGSTISNPTGFKALPLIVVTNPTASAQIKFTNSAGTYTLNSSQAYTGTVTIDCDQMNIYSGATNLNGNWTGAFPVLHPGTTTITFSGIGTFKITPRWWEL